MSKNFKSKLTVEASSPGAMPLMIKFGKIANTLKSNITKS